MNLGELLRGQKKADSLERALVFVTVHGGTFLAGFGPGIDSDREAGLDPSEIGPVTCAPAGPGLWIWEGTPSWVEERSEGILEGCTPDYHGRGTWSRPTIKEIARVCSGDISYFADHEEEAT